MEQVLTNQIRDYGIEGHVTFTGPVDHHQVKPYLTAMDIGVSPRATFYASPMKILEYMAMTLATVAPRMPNITDIVDDGENALLFEAENHNDLTTVLERLVQDADLAKRLGVSSRRKIESRLNWKFNATRIVEQAVRMRHSETGAIVGIDS